MPPETPFPWAPVIATLLCGALVVWALALRSGRPGDHPGEDDVR